MLYTHTYPTKTLKCSNLPTDIILKPYIVGFFFFFPFCINNSLYPTWKEKYDGIVFGLIKALQIGILHIQYFLTVLSSCSSTCKYTMTLSFHVMTLYVVYLAIRSILYL